MRAIIQKAIGWLVNSLPPVAGYILGIAATWGLLSTYNPLVAIAYAVTAFICLFFFGVAVYVLFWAGIILWFGTLSPIFAVRSLFDSSESIRERLISFAIYLFLCPFCYWVILSFWIILATTFHFPIDPKVNTVLAIYGISGITTFASWWWFFGDKAS